MARHRDGDMAAHLVGDVAHDRRQPADRAMDVDRLAMQGAPGLGEPVMAGPRSISRRPSRVSSRFSALETVGCLRRSRSAASVTLPDSASATKVRSRFQSKSRARRSASGGFGSISCIQQRYAAIATIYLENASPACRLELTTGSAHDA
jgi:hypothetical protein